MSFFNKKEDVLEIELTQFGKQLLSKGDFQPYYYAFYDDDIIYDNQYAGMINETGSNQNNIEERIKEMPRTKTQYVFTGIETEVVKNNMLIRTGEIMNEGRSVFVGKKDPNDKMFEIKDDRNFSSYNPLANSSLSSQNIPAWNITMYKGEIARAKPIFCSSVNPVLFIAITSDPSASITRTFLTPFAFAPSTVPLPARIRLSSSMTIERPVP